MDVDGQLCYTDAYLRSVEARVIAVDDGGEAPIVVLDRTVFYPGGGGQPSDRGALLRAVDGRSWTVRGAKKSGGDIVHELEPGSGDDRRCRPNRRYSEGTTNRLRTVEVTSPPRMTMAIGYSISCPGMLPLTSR